MPEFLILITFEQKLTIGIIILEHIKKRNLIWYSAVNPFNTRISLIKFPIAVKINGFHTINTHFINILRIVPVYLMDFPKQLRYHLQAFLFHITRTKILIDTDHIIMIPWNFLHRLQYLNCFSEIFLCIRKSGPIQIQSSAIDIQCHLNLKNIILFAICKSIHIIIKSNWGISPI